MTYDHPSTPLLLENTWKYDNYSKNGKKSIYTRNGPQIISYA